MLLAIFAFCGFAIAQQVSMALLDRHRWGAVSTSTTVHQLAFRNLPASVWDRENSFYSLQTRVSAADFRCTRDTS